ERRLAEERRSAAEAIRQAREAEERRLAEERRRAVAEVAERERQDVARRDPRAAHAGSPPAAQATTFSEPPRQVYSAPGQGQGSVQVGGQPELIISDLRWDGQKWVPVDGQGESSAGLGITSDGSET